MANDKAFKVKNGLELAGYDASKAVTAVDVFVYDTSRDSDGGAWRKRTQGTSWYNETLNTATRGARREFPAVAVIVAEAGKVTIYDGDDPALPMWMVFNVFGSNMVGEGNSHSLAALNGVLTVGSAAYDLYLVRFIADEGLQYANSNTISGTYKGNVLQRNDLLSYILGTVPNIINRAVNDVAMTVLPDAPIDPATGLPVPTIAVATDGGVSVIKDDGTVVDLTYTASVSNEAGGVWFPASGGIAWQSRLSSGGYVYTLVENEIPTADKSTASDALYANFGQVNFAENDLVTLGTSQPRDFVDGAIGSPLGLTRIDENPTTPANGMVAYTTSTYNTGWMNGNIKGAFLSDTDDTDLVGSTIYTSDFSSGVDGWTAIGQGTLAAVSSELELTGDGGYNDAGRTALTVVSGKRYIITGKFRKGTSATARVQVQEAFGSFLVLDSAETNSATLVDFKLEFVASGTAYNLALVDWTGGGGTCYIKDVSVKLADADRSVNNNGLIINGTVTRSPVATGADLVAYSGFSASNYLEQPYNSGLDFGTGDFSVMGWVTYSGANNFIIDRQDGASSSTDRLNFFVSASSMSCRCDATLASVSHTFTTGVRYFVAVARKSGVAYFYANGGLVGSATQAGDVTDASASYQLTVAANGQSKVESPTNAALLRISATAPTAEQIAKIYNDEKFLFQDNAQATLYGASDAVTALAHDPVTDLLHVGTSAGRSVFSGLRRVSNTTTAVGTAISARNGMIVEE